MPVGETKAKFDKDVDALVSLNISHLHDASNFFALLKNQIETGEDLDQVKRFSKGAAYHFRALFEELKASKELLSQSEGCELSTLYSKEIIDLKDLLELELLENNRINLIDQCLEERALIEANFGLLTKLIINIVENALKYSKSNIDLELSSKANNYQLKIKSYGANIPENLANDLKSSRGHGLSSSASILAFHSAKIEINSLVSEGTSITISFNKTQEQKVKVKKPKKRQELSRFSFVSIMALAIFLSLCSLKTGFEEQNIRKNAERRSSTQVSFKQELKELNYAYLSNQDSELKLNQILTKVKNKDMAHYALLISLPKDQNWDLEVKQLLNRIPAAYDLRLAYADSLFSQKQYIKGFEATVIALYYYFSSNNQEHKIAKYIVGKRGLEYYLSSIAHANSATRVSRQKKNQTIMQSTNKQASNNPGNPNKQFQELNQLIEEQNQALGLDLEL